MKKLLLVGALSLSAAACAPDVKQDPAPDVVVAQFDPSASPAVVPSPNDLAINPATGLVNAPIDPNAPAAQQEFTRDYLNTLNGFPTSVVATTKLADLDKDSISLGTTVRFIDLLQGTPIATPAVTPTVAYDEDTDTLAIVPPAGGWPKGGRYAVALIGGANGLKGVGGKPVVGSAVWEFASSDKPLVTCEDLTAPNCQSTTDLIPSDEEDPAERIKDQTASALRLEQLRRSYAPLLDAVASQGVEREDIVLLWTFRIMNQPEATFDPAAGVIPFPNNILLKRNEDGTTQVNLPIPPGASPTQQQLFAGLNTLDGFSTTAPIVSENGNDRGVIDTGSRLDAVNLAQATMFLKLTPGGTAPQVRACLNPTADPLCPPPTRTAEGTVPNNPQQLLFVPQVPLDEKSTYGAVLTTGLKDERGRFLAPPGAFALVRLSSPLVVDGRSQVSGVSDANANALEPLRAGLKPMFDALAAQGLPRSKIALAWAFSTQSTVSTQQKLHALPATQYGPAGLPNSPLYLFDITAQVPPSANVSKVFQGSIVLPFVVTGPGGTLNPTQPRMHRVPFLLAVPPVTAETPANGFPVTIFSHGFRSHRNTALPIINALAEKGHATIAIDTVFHGDRSSCAGITAAAGITEGDGGPAITTPDGACAVGTCDISDPASPTYGRCVAPGGETCDPSPTAAIPGDIICSQAGQGRCIQRSANPTDGTCEGGYFKVSASGTPYISGWNMLNLGNLFATRDNFRQHTIELAQVERVLAADGIDALLTAQAAGKLDGTRIHYLGQSLGGILGPIYTAASPNVQNAVFNVPGGNLTGYLLTSPAFAQAKAGFVANLASQKIYQGTPAFDQFLGLSRMILDPADPINYAYAVENGPASPTGREALIQYIDQDQVTPNPTTEALINAANNRAADQKQVATSKFTPDPQESLPLPLRHGYLLDPRVSSTIRDAAQSEAVNFLETGALP
ncbi:MAG: hypothetical protein JXB05_28855 [Myxococcaceae bacterium]|nr:hypothetical protein [Myxococcaceae bacterium]